jgi:tetratricopeptide (TPR) repeat protein
VVPIDYLVPAEVSFPAQIRRVGIVNNVGETPGRVAKNTIADSILLEKTNGFLERYTLNGDPKITAEALAESLAGENYFDEVIICDSMLQASGTPKQAPFLGKEAVNALTERLDVDMLISLEEIRIEVKRQVFPMADMGFLGTVDAKVYPEVNLYIAHRNAPLVMINGNDSIFWEDFESTLMAARTKVVPDEQLIAEASGFAGALPVRYMTPHWKTAGRFFYNNGSPEMRDAAFFVRENRWDKAFALWETFFEKAKGIKKARVASNISLYYEMKDDLEKAHEWGEKALELAKVVREIPEDEHTTSSFNDYTRIRYNQSFLEERRSHFAALKMQMNRFRDDF